VGASSTNPRLKGKLISAESSGTFVGMAYAARYPQRVNQFVIDAAIPHGMVCKSSLLQLQET
jgi:pimeloyl-ACP methyl ester carboxylesterase